MLKRHTNHRNESINGTPITGRPCPFYAYGKGKSTYVDLKIGSLERYVHHGCVVPMSNEDTININFNVYSTDEKGNISINYVKLTIDCHYLWICFIISVNGSKLDTLKHWALLLVPMIDGSTKTISEDEMGLRAQINIQVNCNWLILDIDTLP